MAIVLNNSMDNKQEVIQSKMYLYFTIVKCNVNENICYSTVIVFKDNLDIYLFNLNDSTSI